MLEKKSEIIFFFFFIFIFTVVFIFAFALVFFFRFLFLSHFAICSVLGGSQETRRRSGERTRLHLRWSRAANPARLARPISRFARIRSISFSIR